MLTIFNSLTKRKDLFIPNDPNNVKFYCCGPTVYDAIHLGNARPLVVFDILYRLLKFLYPNVMYVRNITDIDDKINERAKKNNTSITQLTAQTILYLKEDTRSLLCLDPNIEPRATDHITDMITLIKNIILNGHGYISEGHVLFDVSSFPRYGILSGRMLDQQEPGARISVASYKKNPLDFVLWKPSQKEKHEPGWDSPWGYGRPGWHVECSAMSVKYLGKNFDLHGGGVDLLFPHHENEFAQCMCGFKGSAFANIWMHNGYLLFNGSKMSKSLDNFYTVQDLRKEFPGEVLRLVLLQTHYRQPLDFKKEKCFSAKKSLDRLYRAADLVRGKPYRFGGDILQLLCDDLNTPAALALLFEYASRLQKGDFSVVDSFLEGLSILGLGQCDHWFQRESDFDTIQVLIHKREQARISRDYAQADSIRQALLSKGIVLEDRRSGTTFRYL